MTRLEAILIVGAFVLAGALLAWLWVSNFVAKRRVPVRLEPAPLIVRVTMRQRSPMDWFPSKITWPWPSTPPVAGDSEYAGSRPWAHG